MEDSDFDFYLDAISIQEDCIKNIEKNITFFINEEWNPDLDFYVEVVDKQINLIVFLHKICPEFKQFVLDEICKEYNVILMSVSKYVNHIDKTKTYYKISFTKPPK